MVREDRQDDVEFASEKIPVPQVQRDVDMTGTTNKTASIPRVKPRPRKKALYAAIIKQMEFYFGDANLSKDRFLGNLLKNDPYVDLSVFTKFNKIRELTTDPNRIAKALQASKMLSISEDGTKVRRITPIAVKENTDECTLYVQNLPPDIDHEWLRSVFTEYGSIEYVSLPRYKSNKKLKGFAFIEFGVPDAVKRCIKAFQERGCVLPSYTSPEELLSITTFEEPEKDVRNLFEAPISEHCIAKEEIKSNKIDTKEVEGFMLETQNVKRIETDTLAQKEKECSVEKKTNLKRKHEEMNSEEKDAESAHRAKRALKESDEVADTNDKTGKNIETEERTVQMRSSSDKKKKRKRNRNHKMEDIDCTFGLQVMTKTDWKRLRNKYLDLQRSKMKELKQHLRKKRRSQWLAHDKARHTGENEEKELVSKTETAAIRNFNFTSGVIAKMELNEPCSDPRNFKMELKGNSNILYIDVTEGSYEAYIRCDTPEAACALLQKFKDMNDRNVTILEGEEEHMYWNKMLHDKEEKLNNKIRVKQRGRDKLLKKAEKELGKHIKFEEV